MNTVKLAGPVLFLSTLSLRRATRSNQSIISQTNISIHALLAESDTTYFDTSSMEDLISIHALLAESDRYWPCVPVVGRAISIHALLAESDPMH